MLVVLGNFGPWEFQTGTVVKGWRTNGNVFGVSTHYTTDRNINQGLENQKKRLRGEYTRDRNRGQGLRNQKKRLGGEYARDRNRGQGLENQWKLLRGEDAREMN